MRKKFEKTGGGQLENFCLLPGSVRMATIGDELIELLSGARSEATIVAPFMKAAVVKRLMQNLAPGVILSCITRWHPHEIKYGVSDLEVWDVLRAHQPSSLSLIPTLHAKFYRADDHYAIGSANLTNAALGWSTRPNVELLITGEVDQRLRDWESFLLSQATTVDESLVRLFERLVDDLPDDNLVFTEHYSGAESSFDEEYGAPNLEVMSWLPMTRYPEQLYKAYLGDTEELSAGARESAKYDLLALAVPKGLDPDGFGVSVAASLLQMPVVHRIDQFLAQPRSFGAVRDFLGALPQYPQHRDPSADWQTMMRWFRHFLPQRFHVSVPNYSEVTFRVE